MKEKFGINKIIGFIITFPFLIFMITAFLYIPIDLYRTSTEYIGTDINPIELIQKDVWNPTPANPSEQSFGLTKTIMTSLRVSIESTIFVLPIGFLFAVIILYLSPLWIRNILEMFRDLLYLMPVILIAYLGYFYLSPLITGEEANISGLLTSRVLIIFAFPYTVFAFMFGLTRLWGSVNTSNPTFGGKVVKMRMKGTKVVSFIFVIITVACITAVKIFGETLIFGLLSGMSSPANYMDITQSTQSLGASVFQTMSTVTDGGIALTDNLVLGMMLFISFLLYIVVFAVSFISNLGLSFIGHLFHHETQDTRTQFGKMVALRGFFKVLFSIIGLLFVGVAVYFLIRFIPKQTEIIKLLQDFPDMKLALIIDSFEITGKSVFHFAVNFIGYALFVGVPVGLFMGVVIKGSPLEHYIVGLIRTFDNIPVICAGIFGYSFFALSGNVSELNMFSAGMTTALFLSPKVAILTYEIFRNSKNNYDVIKLERPYISPASFVFTSLVRVVGTAFQVFGMLFGVLVTIMFTGVKFPMPSFLPYSNAPMMSWSHQLYLLMSNNANIESIKPILDNYYLAIFGNFALYFLIGCGIKFLISLYDSHKLRDFHKKEE